MLLLKDSREALKQIVTDVIDIAGIQKLVWGLSVQEYLHNRLDFMSDSQADELMKAIDQTVNKWWKKRWE